MKFTTISGEVKELKRLRSPGETSVYFKIDDQCVRLFTRLPVIKEGDRVVVAGKLKRGQFVSYAMHNLTQSSTTGQSGSTKFVPYVFGSLFTGIGLVIIIDHIFHAHNGFVLIIAGILLFIGLALFYFTLSQSQQKSLVKKAAQDYKS